MIYQFGHGERFGRLTVLNPRPRHGRIYVGCACGHKFSIRGALLRKGKVTSCGECAGTR